jgi:outer membrane protein assembly factor BamA
MRSYRRLFTVLAVGLFLTEFLHADCEKDRDHRSSKNSGLLITDFTISGTQTLSSAELARIAGKLTGSCFDENSEELQERVRELFQERGYFGAVVKNLRIKPEDPLGIPKPATLEAEVSEGPRYKLAEVKFTDQHAFSATKLRGQFPLRKGDLFDRDKVAGGLDGIHKLYNSDGFIDFVAMPETHILSDATITLSLSVEEGPQYRMEKLEIFAKKEMADSLREEWQLAEGAVFDPSYVDKYISENSSQLPLGFSPQDVKLVRNCRDASVEVMLLLDATSPSLESQPKDVACDPANNAPK